MSDRPLTEHDDRAHEHGGEHGWTETLSLTFSDPAIIGALRLHWDPAERVWHGDVLIRLEDGTVVRAHERRSDAGARDTSVGGIDLETLEPMKHWKLRLDLKAFAAPTAAGILVRPGGKGADLKGQLEIRATGDADGFATRRQTITEQRFASIVSSGSFAQPIAATGELRVGERRLRLDAVGVRARTWGVREHDPSDARIHVAFDAEHALWFERGILGDAEVAVAGSIGSIKVADQLEVTRDDDGTPTKLVLGGLTCEVLAAMIAEPGEPSDRFVLRCRNGALEALGVAELAIRDVAPVAAVGEPAQAAGEPAGDVPEAPAAE